MSNVKKTNRMTLSYHNDPAVKAWHVEQAKHHLAADMLVSGTYGDLDEKYFRGCSIGCMAHDIDPTREDYHAVVAEHAGWPEWLARLNDSIFEGLPKGDREPFHVDLREAIPVGVDLEPIRHKLALRRIDRLIETQTKALDAGHGDQVTNAIKRVLVALVMVRRCHEAEIGGNTCDWSAAEASAWSAVDSAALTMRSAEASSARRAAEAAAWTVRSTSLAMSAEASAMSAAESAAADDAFGVAAKAAAWTVAWQQEAADLLELLRSAAHRTTP